MNGILKSYLQEAIIDLLEHNVEVKFVHRLKDCSGMFIDDNPKKLKFICKLEGELDKLVFETFIHEYCHFKQHLENKYNDKDCLDSIQRFWSWLDKEDFTKSSIAHSAKVLQDLETDCEKRVVEEIKKWKLPMDIELYIQRANAYIYLYNMMLKFREWPKIAPTRFDEIVSTMPKEFLGNYSKTPKKYYALTKRLCFKK